MVKLDAAIEGELPAHEKPLSEAAQRALAEAAERRKIAEASVKDGLTQKEIGGRSGLDPARYGDWEVKGIVSDF